MAAGAGTFSSEANLHLICDEPDRVIGSALRPRGELPVSCARGSCHRSRSRPRTPDFVHPTLAGLPPLLTAHSVGVAAAVPTAGVLDPAMAGEPLHCKLGQLERLII